MTTPGQHPIRDLVPGDRYYHMVSIKDKFKNHQAWGHPGNKRDATSVWQIDEVVLGGPRGDQIIEIISIQKIQGFVDKEKSYKTLDKQVWFLRHVKQ